MKFDVPVSPEIQRLREKREQSNRNLRLNTERNRIITEYYKTHEYEYPVLKRAGYLYEWCATLSLIHIYRRGQRPGTGAGKGVCKGRYESGDRGHT